MKSLNLSLDSIQKIKTFVEIIKNFDCELDLRLNKYTVNAKSIMGIMSLDLTKTLILDIHDDFEFNTLAQKLKDLIIT